MTHIEKHALWVLRRLRKQPTDNSYRKAHCEWRRFQGALRRNLTLVTVVDWLLERGLVSNTYGVALTVEGIALVNKHSPKGFIQILIAGTPVRESGRIARLFDDV